jgi:hypothetical protein
MDLARDCLDKLLLDRNKRPMGRVDGIILQLDANRAPRVAYIELGKRTVADRFGGRFGQLVARLLPGKSTERFRIPWGKLQIGLNEVTADVDAEKTAALAFEVWLRKKIIGRIPGA